jgi:hypothetical protein
MVDPTGGIGKASAQMMQEMQKQMAQAAQEQQKVGGPQFDNVMSQQGVNDPSKVADLQKTQQVQQPNNATDVLRTAQSQQVGGVDKGLDVKRVEGTTKPVEATKSESGLKALLGQVVQGQDKLDQIIKMATSGKTYGNQELLAIQASVYKFSQELELTSKVVEKATSGVKQTMQTQV